MEIETMASTLDVKHTKNSPIGLLNQVCHAAQWLSEEQRIRNSNLDEMFRDVHIF